ncbi:arginine N-succinyltransferase [Marinobacterium jannaschii]|uniref:arginine N-succinyltransferase n=1 Tax=Marinobacterium jannaschii TaxID=64970 RepID=UPI000484DF61|nr:arginine N-succinyltransferase [Marinobacterium jannaschii]
MLTIRPLAFSDLQALERLAVIAGGNLTTLPANRDHLSELINRTRQSLRQTVSRPGDQSYHFVLEDSDGELLGIAGIEAAVGLNSPFYSYRLDEVVHASSELRVHNRIPSMHLCQDFDGYSRLYTFYLIPQHRTARNLQLLSRARLLFMAQHPQRFAHKTLAELQGLVDEQGQSPLWECLGRHFFSMELERANYLTGIDAKGFIADLMPHYPVYLPMLPEAVRNTLGQPRPDIADTMQLLTDEGFRHQGYVDIFDAGPTLEARTGGIHSIRDSISCPLRLCDSASGVEVLVSNTRLEAFRCAITRLDPSRPMLSAATAQQLGLEDGDDFRFIPLYQAD